MLPNSTAVCVSVDYELGDIICSDKSLSVYEESVNSEWISLANAGARHGLVVVIMKNCPHITLYGVHGGEVTLAQENGRYQHFRLHPLEVKT